MSSKRGYLSKAQSDAVKNLLRLTPEIGREYIVSKYWTGTFQGRLLSIENPKKSHSDKWILRFLVTDDMRPGPPIEEKCSFPECTAESEHDGDHVFAEFRNGSELEIRYGCVELRPAVMHRVQRSACA